MRLVDRLTRSLPSLGIFIFFLVSLFSNPGPAGAESWGGQALPSFREFSQMVWNGDAHALRGVYVRNVLALPVVQQPEGNPGFVSNTDDEVTQFAMASGYGNVGILAHNYLSGRSFPGLALGQEIRLVYGDGGTEHFVVSEILRYQALQPENPKGSFRDLETGRILSAGQLFRQVYGRSGNVTFQTCIEANGDPSWGRLFVIAVPREAHTRSGRHGG